MRIRLSFDVNAVPKEWSVIPCGVFFKEKSVKNTESEINLSVYRDFGVIPTDSRDDNHNKVSEDTSNYKLVDPGDLVLNKMKGWSGSLGVSDYRGIVSPSYTVLKPVKKIHNKYFHYLLRSELYRQMYESLSYGVRIGQWELRYHDFKQIPSLYPPLEEQKLISLYLNKKTQQIDRLVEKIQKKIELLKEQRISLINQCVTKGLDPNMEMRDSGIEWIGKIPKHWDVTRLKFHGSVLIGLSFDKEDIVDENKGTLVLRSSNVQNGVVTFGENIWVKSKVPEKLLVQNGDILICSRNGSRNLIGKNCLLGEESLGMTWGVFMSVFRTKNPNFFHWVLNSQVFKSQAGLYLTSTINQLKVSTLENLKFPFVSDSIEQKKIHDFLSEETGLLDKLIKQEIKRIDLLKEYRQSLISSAVTGKIRITKEMI